MNSVFIFYNPPLSPGPNNTLRRLEWFASHIVETDNPAPTGADEADDDVENELSACAVPEAQNGFGEKRITGGRYVHGDGCKLLCFGKVLPLGTRVAGVGFDRKL